jgi:glycerol-3-phosphate acyltransferase PlsY
MGLIVAIALGYLAGSIPTGFLIGKVVKGIDIRTQGSGNVGATNVFRVVGRTWGIAVLLFDILKGFLAVTIIPDSFYWEGGSPFLNGLLVGIAAIAGHTWTVWLGFRGGKGVATSLGVFLGLAPKAVGMSLLVWGLLFVWKRYVSLGSLGLAASLPVWVVVFYRREEYFATLLMITLGLAVFIFTTHRENIKRLREGREKRLI